MGSHVCCDRTTLRESPVTNRTPEWFLTGMSSGMCCQISSLAEGFGTRVASEIRRFISPFTINSPC